MNIAQQRVTVIKLSLRIWRLGWLSLVPLAGIGAVLSNCITLWHLRSLECDWNPARNRMIIGCFLSLYGALVSLVIVLVLFAHYYEEIVDFTTTYIHL